MITKKIYGKKRRIVVFCQKATKEDASHADLYDETTMLVKLCKAHQNNDRAVMQANGFSVKDMTESQCVTDLMNMYQKLTEG